MVNFLRQFFVGLAEAWNQLSLSARVNIVLSGVAVLVVIGGVVLMGARPQYVTLTENAEAGQVNEIVKVLTSAGVPYRLANQDRTITVPLSERSNVMLLLAEAKLPVGRTKGPGFDIFDTSELMSNKWLQDVKFMRAVKGEIERQLALFDFVDYAVVNITKAQTEMFASKQSPSKASVTLKTTRPPSTREIDGIVSMVGNAGGTHLHRDNITVATTEGKFLHLPSDDPYTAAANDRREVRVEEERYREQLLMAKLDEMSLRGTVSVSAILNFDRKEIVAKLAADGAEVSSYETTTKLQSEEKLPEGAPGTLANVPEGAAAAGGVLTTEDMSEEITNSEPSYTTTTTTSDGGDVVKYIVTMAVEGDYEEAAAAEDGGEAARTYLGLSEARRQMLSDIAKAAVGEGLEETEVTVHDMQFEIAAPADDVAARQAAEQRVWMMGMVWNAAQILLIILGFFLVRVFLRSIIEYPVEDLEEEEEVKEIPEATKENMRREQVASQLARMAQEDPEMVATLLRTWLSEEED